MYYCTIVPFFLPVKKKNKGHNPICNLIARRKNNSVLYSHGKGYFMFLLPFMYILSCFEKSYKDFDQNRPISRVLSFIQCNTQVDEHLINISIWIYHFRPKFTLLPFTSQQEEHINSVFSKGRFLLQNIIDDLVFNFQQLIRFHVDLGIRQR